MELSQIQDASLPGFVIVISAIYYYICSSMINSYGITVTVTLHVGIIFCIIIF